VRITATDEPLFLQVEQAQASSDKIEAELKDLKATLQNIQEARPFDQLTVDEVIAARPEIRETVEAMVKQGKWTTPQYTEKFGSEWENFRPRTIAGADSISLALHRLVSHLVRITVETKCNSLMMKKSNMVIHQSTSAR
jgi:hypothetical protein